MQGKKTNRLRKGKQMLTRVLRKGATRFIAPT